MLAVFQPLRSSVSTPAESKMVMIGFLLIVKLKIEATLLSTFELNP